MVDWKKVILDPQATSAQVFGGDVVNGLTQYHSNVDLAAGDPLGEVQIATKTTFKMGKILLGDSGDDHTVQFSIPNFSENKTVQFPSTLATTDDLVLRTTIQTLTNKNIDGVINTFTNIPNSALAQITDKAKLNSQIGYKDDTNWLTDAMVSSHTSTKITITAKGQLNSAIPYTDQTNTYGNFDQIFRSGMLDLTNPANTFKYNIAGGAIIANRVLTLPALGADDTVVTEAFAQPLTNKTIAAGSNTLTGIVDANISAHTSTKITITAKGQLNTAIVYNDQANTFSADITMADTRNIVLNTTTGTRIGTAITQKLGFYNATPIVQGASIADITTTATGTQISVAVNAIISRLEALGLIATV